MVIEIVRGTDFMYKLHWPTPTFADKCGVHRIFAYNTVRVFANDFEQTVNDHPLKTTYTRDKFVQSDTQQIGCDKILTILQKGNDIGRWPISGKSIFFYLRRRISLSMQHIFL